MLRAIIHHNPSRFEFRHSDHRYRLGAVGGSSSAAARRTMHTMPPDTPRHSRPLGPPGLVERDALVLGRNHAVRRAVRGRYSLHRIAPSGTGGPRASSRQSLSEACIACGRAVTRACARAHTPAAAGRVARQRAQAAVHRPGAMRGPVPCAARCRARPGAVRGPVPCAARCRAARCAWHVTQEVATHRSVVERERVSGNG